MAATSTRQYLGVYKALYAYEAQGDDEVAMEEDQLVFVLDNSDDDWVKVKVKTSSQELDGPEGLVPAAYIEKAQPIGTVKAAYDYEANAQGELSMEEGQTLQIHEKDEEWILVESTVNGKIHIGYVPANYVEEADGSTESSQPAPVSAAVVVPDSPPRPAYIAPEERTAAVAASADKSKHDKIETWAVSQLDKKGKKKKGTLGVGGGAIFFASESDKTPVQKWQTSDITGASVDKSKHIQVDFKNSESLRFLSKDAAEAIHQKIENSRELAGGGMSPRPSTDTRSILDTPRAMEVVSPPKASEPKSVHFAVAPTTIPIQDYDEGDDGDEGEGGMHGETAVALYDFVGDAGDELSVKEGETVSIIDRSNDDWWKCRNQKGQEGVVPAQYLDLEASEGEPETSNTTSASNPVASAAAAAAANAAAARAARAPSPEEDSEEEREREAEAERLEKERKEKERQQREREKERARAERAEREEEERRARAEEEERLSNERKRVEEKKARAAAQQQQKREAEAQQKKEAERKAAKSQKLKKRQADDDDEDNQDDEEDDDALAKEAQKMTIRRAKERNDGSQNTSRPNSGVGRHGPPPTGKTRVWHDRSGQFRVEAEFKGVENHKIRLHKLNGVTIEVPLEKMSQEDLAHVEMVTGMKFTKPGRDEDEVPLAKLAKPAQPQPAIAPARSPRPRQDPQPKNRVDWFEFFLNAGCEMDDCTRYAQAFDRDKIDETILPDLKAETLRALGLREGDIIRVVKAIEKRQWRSSSVLDQPGVRAQIEADELYAKQVQEALLAGKKPPPPPGPLPMMKPSSPAPNLFAGPGGVLKDNTRRGRPTPAKSASINVDENTLANASSQLKVNSPVSTTARTPSPNLIDSSNTTSPTAAPAPSKPSGFDDDAWTPRPSSTNPISPVVAVTPPAAPASAPPAPPVASPPPSTTDSKTAALERELELLQKIDELKRASAASVSPPPRPSTTDPLQKELELLQKIADLKRPPSAPAPYQAPAPPPVPSPALPTGSFLSTLKPQPGATLGALQAQPTGIYAGTPPLNAARGPFAPVPQNEAVLLKPLVPTTTGFTGFIPTKPGGTGILPQATGFGMQTSPFQAQTLQPIPTSPFQPQPTGFVGLAPQPTGFMGPSPVMTQATGLPFGFQSTPSPIPPVPQIPNQFTAVPSFQQQSPFANPAPITTQPLGSFNFSNPPTASPPPPDHSPANVFASMKAGNFGGDEHAAPSPANYDALRNNPGANPMLSQPTGWIPSSMQPGYPYR